MRVARIGGQINSPDELHYQLKQELELPEFYGGNLDALWDCLTGYIETPLTIEWHDFGDCRARIGDYADKVVSVFEDAQREVEGFRFILK